MKRLLALVAAIALAASACGDDVADDPKQALRDALDNLAEAEGIAAQLTIVSDVDSLVAAFEGELEEADVQKILDSSIRASGNQANKIENARREIVVNLAGEDSIEIRVIGLDFYARADVAHIAETLGEDPAEIEQMTDQAPPGFEWVKEAVQGEWIHFAGLGNFLKSFAPSDTPPAGDSVKKILNTAGRIRVVGEEDPGTHLIVSVPLREAYREFKKIAQRLEVPGQAPLPPENEVPDKSIDLDVWVDGDTLTQMEVDFLKLVRQFAEDPEIPSGVDKLGFRVAFEDFEGGIAAPESSTEVNMQELMGAFGGGLGGMGAGQGTTAPGPDCSQFANAPKDVLEQMRPQLESLCPELY